MSIMSLLRRIDLKSSVHSITCPSSHGAGPRILYCHFVVMSITCILIYMGKMFNWAYRAPYFLLTRGPIPRIPFEIMKEKMGPIMLQRIVYTLIKFQGPQSLVNTAFHQRLTGLQPLNHVILTTPFTNQNNWRRYYNDNQYQNISCLRAYSTYLELSNIYFYFYLYSTIYIYIYIYIEQIAFLP